MNTTDNLYYDWSRDDDLELREQFPKAFIYAVDWLLPYQLTTLLLGGHEPQWVENVMARVRELSVPNKVFPDSALMMVMGYMIIMARDAMEKN